LLQLYQHDKSVPCVLDHAAAPGLPAVLSRLESLVVGDTCTLSYVDDSLLVLLAKHAKRLTALDCSGGENVMSCFWVRVEVATMHVVQVVRQQTPHAMLLI
jgi:hypothetical protein